MSDTDSEDEFKILNFAETKKEIQQTKNVRKEPKKASK